MALSINRTQAPGERRPQGLEGGTAARGTGSSVSTPRWKMLFPGEHSSSPPLTVGRRSATFPGLPTFRAWAEPGPTWRV